MPGPPRYFCYTLLGQLHAAFPYTLLQQIAPSFSLPPHKQVLTYCLTVMSKNKQVSNSAVQHPVHTTCTIVSVDSTVQSAVISIRQLMASTCKGEYGVHARVLRNRALSRGGLSNSAILGCSCGCCLGPPHVTQGQILMQAHGILGYSSHPI